MKTLNLQNKKRAFVTLVIFVVLLVALLVR